MADVELSSPLRTVSGIDGYTGLQGLVRLHGQPLGWVHLPVVAGRVEARELASAVLKDLEWPLLLALSRRFLTQEEIDESCGVADLLRKAPPPPPADHLPSITVAVCTRDRVHELAGCLSALEQLRYPKLDLLVIDNAPSTSATRELVASRGAFRYVCEPLPGLDNARNRAIAEARGEIIAFTDDDCAPDVEWAAAIGRLFADNPEVGAATGLVVPLELETEAQILFERCGGFGRGFERKWFYVPQDAKIPWEWAGTGRFGTGANMAFRRSLFERIGHFDPALDVGTSSRGGGDLEMFFRVLQEKEVLVYEPSAIVRHRHRPGMDRLLAQLGDNGAGLAAYFARSIQAYPSEWSSFLRLWIWWVRRWIWARYKVARFQPARVPPSCVRREWSGFFGNIGGYFRARETAEKRGCDFSRCRPSPESSAAAIRPAARQAFCWTGEARRMGARAAESVQAKEVTFIPLLRGEPLGIFSLGNRGVRVGQDRFADEASVALLWRVLETVHRLPPRLAWLETVAALRQHLLQGEAGEEEHPPAPLPASVSVSVVVATRDRPTDLRNCLRALSSQKTSRQVEIIVVDNHPNSGMTAAVVADFPGVILVEEARPGLSYARNAGILSAAGEIVVATDDDVTMPEDWIEKLVAPFRRADVGIVTGNVLPVDLDTPAARLFEAYGGLGRGFERWVVGREWFDSFHSTAVPTWNLGATANAAFRARLFREEGIGLFDERLGAGSPTGCSEDTYLFYKVLKSGHAVAYEPAAYVWHHHRATMEALRGQIFNYSKGHVAYHLLTWREEGDWRCWKRLAGELPRALARRAWLRLRGRSDYPLHLLLHEVRGLLLGPWALWRSSRRVARLGGMSGAAPVPVAKIPTRWWRLRTLPRPRKRKVF